MLRAACLLALVATALAVPTYSSTSHERIVNGTDAPAGKYPYMVSYQKNDKHKCGGTIINENYVLTTVNCVEFDDVSTLSILSGTIDLNAGGTRHQVTKLRKHENWDPTFTKNDIALVKVDPPFVWDDMTAPVALPPQLQFTPAGSPATLIGWGYPESGGSVMPLLQEVDLLIMDDDECNKLTTNEYVHNSCICAYYPGGGKGQCSGDAGTPLMVGGQQVGAVSWYNYPCGSGPGASTQVAYFRNWIDLNSSA